MKASEIEIGGVYRAKVSNKIVNVKVDSIEQRSSRFSPYQSKTEYHVTNLSTGRKLKFHSAAKFRSKVN